MNWDLVAPVSYKPMHGISDGISVPFSWDGKVTLDRVPEWIKEPENLRIMSEWQRERLWQAELALITKYELEVPDLQPNLGKAQEWIRFVPLSIWLVRPCDFTYEFIFERSVGIGSTAGLIEQIQRTFADPRDEDGVLRQSHLESSVPVFVRIIGLSRTSAVWLSLFALWRALSERLRFHEFRMLLFWVGLEALFGADQPGETVHKIAERMAVFLEGKPERRAKVYSRIKSLYDFRSKVAHGMKPRKKATPNNDLEMLYETQEFLRSSLLKILLDEALTARFSASNRDAFLNEMVLTQGFGLSS